MMKKSIVLIGFMGVGKTTVGKMLAEKMQLEFIDTDYIIADHFKMSIPEIFRKFGEKTFRKKEKEIIINCVENDVKIISVGGGAFLQEEIKNSCLQNSTVVYLDISWDVWKERLPLLIDSRPVLQGKTIDEIEELFYKRKQFYQDHHVKILTDEKNSEEVAREILQQMNEFSN